MKCEIKQRIKQIKAGQVPDGYKKTKIGIMPTEWEEKRIGDVLTQRKTLMCVSKDAPLLSFTIEEGVIEPENKKSNKRDFLIKDISTKKFALTEKGDIIYNPANLKFGAIHRNNLRRGVLSPIYGIFYGEQNSEFMGYLLHNQRFIDYAKIYTEGTVEKLKTLKADTFLRLKIVLPPLAEQEKIVKILSTQDRIIELYQRKIEELQKMKKIYLSKMFPKKGENAPEWRFSQFNDSWEQRKVSDLAEKTYGGGTPTTSNEAYWNGDIPWIQSSDVVDGKLLGVEPRKWITQDGLNNSAAQLIPGNSIAIITRVGVGKLAFMPYSYATSQDFLSLSKLNTEPLFTVYACYKKLQSELNAVQGTSIKGITKDELLAKNIMVPRYAEQQQIGAFFKQLDHLIILHQRKLEETKKYKKALMQLLLTGIVRCKW